MAISQSASITAQNTFCTSIGILGWFNVSVSLPSGANGSTGSTVTVQRSFDYGTTWRDVKSYTTTIEEYGFEPEGALYRIGVKTGAYGASQVNVRLGHEGGMTR